MGVQYATRYQPEDQFVFPDDQGMARVGTAGVPDDRVGGFTQQVDDFAFAFVAPLRPDDDYGGQLKPP